MVERLHLEQPGPSDAPGEIVVVGDGEYCETVVEDGRLFVSWSSQLDAASYISTATEFLGTPMGESEEDGYAVLRKPTEDGDAATGTPSEIVAYAAERPQAVSYLRVTLEDRTRLGWRESAIRIKGGTTPFTELLLECEAPTDRLATISALVGATATQTLAAQIGSLPLHIPEATLTHSELVKQQAIRGSLQDSLATGGISLEDIKEIAKKHKAGRSRVEWELGRLSATGAVVWAEGHYQTADRSK